MGVIMVVVTVVVTVRCIMCTIREWGCGYREREKER